MLRLMLCLLVMGISLAAVTDVRASDDARQRLAEVKKQKQQALELRQRLERKLGRLGREVRELDRRLAAASLALHEVELKYRRLSEQVRQLQQRQRQLQQEIGRLRALLLEEAAAAWKRAGHYSAWQMWLGGTDIRDIPHRRYLLHRVMRAQQEDRLRLQGMLVELGQTEEQLRARQSELASILEQRRQAERDVREQRAAKASLMQRLQRDVKAQKAREAMLANQEKALLELIQGIRRGLMSPERRQAGRPVRKLKGRLPWPLPSGHIVASFGSRPAPGLPRLAGVELAPRKTREVRAIASGQVRYADWFGGYGLMLIVDHGDGVISVYAHNDALYREVGDWVEQGEPLALAGSTGWSSRVRLYFELRDNGRPVNPKLWCRR